LHRPQIQNIRVYGFKKNENAPNAAREGKKPTKF
jgi:hypothetical protein